MLHKESKSDRNKRFAKIWSLSRSDAGKQGTGLGLSITKAIFQQHGFRFGVQSAIGMGTTFWFVMNDLPANAAEMAGQE